MKKTFAVMMGCLALSSAYGMQKQSLSVFDIESGRLQERFNTLKKQHDSIQSSLKGSSLSQQELGKLYTEIKFNKEEADTVHDEIWQLSSTERLKCGALDEELGKLRDNEEFKKLLGKKVEAIRETVKTQISILTTYERDLAKNLDKIPGYMREIEYNSMNNYSLSGIISDAEKLSKFASFAGQRLDLKEFGDNDFLPFKWFNREFEKYSSLLEKVHEGYGEFKEKINNTLSVAQQEEKKLNKKKANQEQKTREAEEKERNRQAEIQRQKDNNATEAQRQKDREAMEKRRQEYREAQEREKQLSGEREIEEKTSNLANDLVRAQLENFTNLKVLENHQNKISAISLSDLNKLSSELGAFNAGLKEIENRNADLVKEGQKIQNLLHYIPDSEEVSVALKKCFNRLKALKNFYSEKVKQRDGLLQQRDEEEQRLKNPTTEQKIVEIHNVLERVFNSLTEKSFKKEAKKIYLGRYRDDSMGWLGPLEDHYEECLFFSLTEEGQKTLEGNISDFLDTFFQTKKINQGLQDLCTDLALELSERLQQPFEIQERDTLQDGISKAISSILKDRGLKTEGSVFKDKVSSILS